MKDSEFKLLRSRCIALETPATDDSTREVQFRLLVDMITRLTQEVEALKELLAEKGEAQNFRRIMRHRALSNHGGPGPNPFQYMSVYRLLKTEDVYLQEDLELSAEELDKFKKDVQFRQQLT
ncbi:MAG TPA: hypothetical protein V6C76_02220 [Drouetiella sp.]